MLRRALPLAVTVAAAATVGLSLSGCSKTVKFDLNLVEPCDQRQQALNGVKVFRMTSSGGEEPVVFSTTSPKTLSLPVAEDATQSSFVTIEGFAIEGDANIEAAVNNAVPHSIGRTLPFTITAETAGFEAAVFMGAIDSFGEATNAEGTCQSMTQHATGARGRHGHTATYVPQIKKVLIVGGAVWGSDGAGGAKQDLLGTVELYDPATGTFEDLAPLPGGETRAYHTATVLPDGRVLIAGGFSLLNGSAQANNLSTTIWNPNSPDDHVHGKALRSPRAYHTATSLQDGALIVFVGGCAGSGCTFDGVTAPGGTDSSQLGTTVEVFDTATGDVLPASSGLEVPRAMHAASAIGATRVLVTGGVNPDGPVCSAEIFEIDSGTVTRLGGLTINTDFEANDCPLRHAQVTVSESPLLVAMIGGQTQAPSGAVFDELGNAASAGSAVVRFFSLSGITEPAAAVGPALMLSARAGHGAALLPNGDVIVVGGATEDGQPPVERLTFDATGAVTSSVPAIPLAGSRDRAALVSLPNGEVLFTGGYRQTDTLPETVDDVNVYFPAAPPPPPSPPTL